MFSIHSYLQSLLDQDPFIRKQDFFTVLNAMSYNPNGRHVAWYFIRENWDDIKEL